MRCSDQWAEDDEETELATNSGVSGDTGGRSGYRAMPSTMPKREIALPVRPYCDHADISMSIASPPLGAYAAIGSVKA